MQVEELIIASHHDRILSIHVVQSKQASRLCWQSIPVLLVNVFAHCPASPCRICISHIEQLGPHLSTISLFHIM